MSSPRSGNLHDHLEITEADSGDLETLSGLQFRYYLECLKGGCTHRLALCLATQSFPGTTGTDRALHEGRHNGNQFEAEPEMGDFYLREARRHGYEPSGNAHYYSTLARFPGDPEAWAESRGEIAQRIRDRGWSCQGAVEVEKPRYAEIPDAEPYRVAPKLVEREVDGLIADHPHLALRRAELIEEVSELRSGAPGRRGGAAPLVKLADLPGITESSADVNVP